MVEPRRVYIHAAAALTPPAATHAPARTALHADPDSNLSALAKQVLGQRLRQGSHFVELATIGARLCLDKLGRAPAPETAVYLGTALGDSRKNEALFEQVFPPGTGAAAPFDFINATSNMAAFYVARLAGMSARNLTLTQGLASFERALQLALGDLRAGTVASALVGGADENCFPRASYALRWPLRDDQVMGEGSAWLYLSTEPAGAIAELASVQYVDAAPDALTLARCARELAGDCIGVVCGGELTADDRAALVGVFPRAQCREYIQYCGSYPTASAFGIVNQIEQVSVRGEWLHVNRVEDGAAMLVCWRAS
jgi:hypothetical protein